MTQERGIGAQFGGKYFCLDVRVIRLPQAWSKFAHRDRSELFRGPPSLGQNYQDGVFLEQLETNPSRFLPDYEEESPDDDAVADRFKPGNGAKSLKNYPSTRCVPACP